MQRGVCVTGMAMVRAIDYGKTSVSRLVSFARGSLQRKTKEFFYALSDKINHIKDSGNYSRQYLELTN